MALVHNGIIENFKPLRDELIAEGRTFASETDTEVVAHLVSEKIEAGMSPQAAVAEVLVDGDRFALVTARALSLPPCTCGNTTCQSARAVHGVRPRAPGDCRHDAGGGDSSPRRTLDPAKLHDVLDPLSEREAGVVSMRSITTIQLNALLILVEPTSILNKRWASSSRSMPFMTQNALG